MKIQCSEATYNLLDELGGFKLECRGNIDIKARSSYTNLLNFCQVLQCNPTPNFDDRVRAQ